MKSKNRTRSIQSILLQKPSYLLLSFLIPFFILGTVFALRGVYPFGNYQLPQNDYYNQYYPFLSNLWRKIREGSSLLWSWNGAGSDFLAIIAYYLASPLNLFIVLFPLEWLREVMAIILLIKIGLAGLFCMLFLRYSSKNSNLSQSFFSACYALCAFGVGYSWNIMWIDTFALLPLVIVGVQSLVQENKYRLFTISLFIAVMCNYYIGYMVCLFVAIMFFILSYLHKVDRRSFFHKFALIAFCSAIAIGLTAFLTIPAFSAIQNAYGGEINFPTRFRTSKSFVDILGNLIAFLPATRLSGLPNIYSSMFCLLMIPIFLRSTKISKRECIIYFGLLVLFVLSCSVNYLDFIWHGFHFPNMIPHRFTFLLSFMMVIIAYRAYTLMEYINFRDVLAVSITAVFILVMAIIGPQEWKAIVWNIVLCVIYVLLFAVFVTTKTEPKKKEKLLHITRRNVYQILIVIMIAELSINTYVATESVVTVKRSSYPYQNDNVQQLLDMREPAVTSFYRTDFNRLDSHNDPFLYDCYGLSFFSSTVNVNVARFMKGIGLISKESASRYIYTDTSPFTNALLNLRYLISRDKNIANKVYWDQVAEESGVLLLENNHYLPLGFVVNKEVEDYTSTSSNAFLSQNDLFRRSTGLEGDLFTIFEEASQAHVNYNTSKSAPGEFKYSFAGAPIEASLKWIYEAPVDGLLYIYCQLDHKTTTITVSMDDETLRKIYVVFPGIVCIGSFSKGDVFSISYVNNAEKGSVRMSAAYFNEELFEQGYSLLADEILDLNKFTDTEVAGTITAQQDGLLYTSIPYEKGWTAYIDGKKSDIVLVDGAMCALRIEQGTHDVEFRYHNRTFTIGVITCLISLSVFIAFILLDNHRKKLKTERSL